MSENNDPKNTQNQAEETAKQDSKLNTVPNPPTEDLSDDELNKIAGGAVDMFLKLDGIKGE